MFQFLRLSTKLLAVLRLSVNPIETLYLRLTVKIFQFLRLSTKFLTVLRLSVNPIKTLYVRLCPTALVSQDISWGHT